MRFIFIHLRIDHTSSSVYAIGHQFQQCGWVTHSAFTETPGHLPMPMSRTLDMKTRCSSAHDSSMIDQAFPSHFGQWTTKCVAMSCSVVPWSATAHLNSYPKSWTNELEKPFNKGESKNKQQDRKNREIPSFELWALMKISNRFRIHHQRMNWWSLLMAWQKNIAATKTLLLSQK